MPYVSTNKLTDKNKINFTTTTMYNRTATKDIDYTIYSDIWEGKYLVTKSYTPHISFNSSNENYYNNRVYSIDFDDNDEVQFHQTDFYTDPSDPNASIPIWRWCTAPLKIKANIEETTSQPKFKWDKKTEFYWLQGFSDSSNKAVYNGDTYRMAGNMVTSINGQNYGPYDIQEGIIIIKPKLQSGDALYFNAHNSYGYLFQRKRSGTWHSWLDDTLIIPEDIEPIGNSNLGDLNILHSNTSSSYDNINGSYIEAIIISSWGQYNSSWKITVIIYSPSLGTDYSREYYCDSWRLAWKNPEPNTAVELHTTKFFPILKDFTS